MHLSAVTFVVDDYDRAIDWFTRCLGFAVIDDTDLGGGKRWVLVAPPHGETRLLLARADGAPQKAAIGNQTGGRVAFFLETDDFERDRAAFVERGVTFLETPRYEPYGTVAVFQDLWGNSWDLIQFAPKS